MGIRRLKNIAISARMANTDNDARSLLNRAFAFLLTIAVAVLGGSPALPSPASAATPDPISP